MRRFGALSGTIFAFAGVAACGKTNSLVDAALGTDGARSDASTLVDAAVPGNVNITTHSRCCTEPNGTLEPNIMIVSTQPDGTDGPTATTDAKGTALLTGVLPGGAVTAIYPTSDGNAGFHLTTVVGVKPGDSLVFGDEYIATQTGSASMTLQVPSFDGAVTYQAYCTCGGGSQGDGTTIQMNLECGGGTVAFAVQALDDGGNILASVTIPNIAISDGGTVTFPATGWQQPVTLAESVTGLSDDVDNVTTLALAVSDIYEEQSAGNQSFTPTANAVSNTQTVDGGSARISFEVEMDREGELGPQHSYLALTPTATTAAITAPTMPWLGQLDLNAAAQAAQWLTAGTGNYDGAVIDANWSHTVGETNQPYEWTILLPPGATQFSWATVPTALSQYVPQTTDFPNGNLELLDLSSASGYDQLRAAPEWQWFSPGTATENGDLTGTSSVAYADGGEGFPGRPQVQHAPRAHTHAPAKLAAHRASR